MNLITGATGLVGAHVALQLLQENKLVVAIKREGSDIIKTKKLFSHYTADADTLFNKIKWIDADVCDIYSLLEALEGVNTVYHCAGFVSFNSKDNKQMHRINSEGTANVVNACLEKKVNALCHVSSIATLQNPDITKIGIASKLNVQPLAISTELYVLQSAHLINVDDSKLKLNSQIKTKQFYFEVSILSSCQTF
jgi:nucleoside-diphosphate-sugar epimerase